MWGWGFLWVVGGCAHVKGMPQNLLRLLKLKGSLPQVRWFVSVHFSLGAAIWPLGCSAGPISTPEDTQELERPLGIRADDIFINTELPGCY